MSNEKEDLEYLFQLPQWETLIKIEKRLRDDEIFQMMGVKLDDPAYEKKVAYYKGRAESIISLWGLRDTIRKSKSAKGKTITEDKYAKGNNEKTDEDDFEGF